MTCKAKVELLEVIASKLEEMSKLKPDPALLSAIENLTRVSHTLEPTLPCNVSTSKVWKSLTTNLSELDVSNAPLCRDLSKKLAETIPKVQDVEVKWLSTVKAGIGTLALLSFISLGASPITFAFIVLWIASHTFPVEVSVLSFLTSIFALTSSLPLGLIGILFSSLNLVPIPLGNVVSELEVVEGEEVERLPEVDEDQLLRMFEEVYGREGRQYFYFLLNQLMVSGMSKEEALKEIWNRILNERS